jgi:1-acyl-sn-glycerol-3-phosphate acyltransferase
MIKQQQQDYHLRKNPFTRHSPSSSLRTVHHPTNDNHTNRGAKDTDAQMAHLVKSIKKLDEERAAGKKVPNVFVLGNHTSFLDTVLTVAKMKRKLMFRSRTYMGAFLFDTPIFATVCRNCGHFPVFFKGSKDGDFRVDRAAQDQVDKRVDAHLNNGGVICFFPEGQVNNEPDELMPFRYGGMKKALENDAHLWTFVTYGCDKIWPRKAPVGGFSGSATYSVQCLAPHGARALVAKLRAAAEQEDKAKEDHVLLAEHCRTKMQDQHDKLRLGLNHRLSVNTPSQSPRSSKTK